MRTCGESYNSHSTERTFHTFVIVHAQMDTLSGRWHRTDVYCVIYSLETKG